MKYLAFGWVLIILLVVSVSCKNSEEKNSEENSSANQIEKLNQDDIASDQKDEDLKESGSDLTIEGDNDDV
jgi:hypothetical protein